MSHRGDCHSCCCAPGWKGVMQGSCTHSLFQGVAGTEDWWVLQKERKLLLKWVSKRLFMSLLSLFFVVFLMRSFFLHWLWPCSTVSIRVLWLLKLNWRSILLTIKSLQQLFFFNYILAHFTFFRLKETCLFMIVGEYMSYVFSLAVWKAYLP